MKTYALNTCMAFGYGIIDSNGIDKIKERRIDGKINAKKSQENSEQGKMI